MKKFMEIQVFGSRNQYPYSMTESTFKGHLWVNQQKQKIKQKMTKIYTSRLHPDCAALNSFLVENNIEFEWLENDDAEKFRAEVLKRKIKPTLPCIIVPAEMCDESDTIYQGDVSRWMEMNKIEIK